MHSATSHSDVPFFDENLKTHMHMLAKVAVKHA